MFAILEQLFLDCEHFTKNYTLILSITVQYLYMLYVFVTRSNLSFIF